MITVRFVVPTGLFPFTLQYFLNSELSFIMKMWSHAWQLVAVLGLQSFDCFDVMVQWIWIHLTWHWQMTNHVNCNFKFISLILDSHLLSRPGMAKLQQVSCMQLFNSLASGWFWRFSQKNSSFRLPYQRPSSSADCARELFNGSNGSASLVDSTRKKFFGWWVWIFCEWCHKWSSFTLMLPGLGPNH